MTTRDLIDRASRTVRRPRRLPARAARFFALAATTVAWLAALAIGPAGAAAPPPHHGPVATMGKRTVEAIDIQQAALALRDDPLRARDPARWRRMLLDRCVDRELLAAEAERRGLMTDPEVEATVADRTFLRLYGLVTSKVLVPGITPTPALLDSLRKTGLYQLIDLYYILIPDDARQAYRAMADSLADRLRRGKFSFEQAAKSYSVHPSKGNGGHFGPMLVRDLDPRSYPEVLAAKDGAVLGPYSGKYGHEIYKVGGFSKLTDDSLFQLVRFEREKGLVRDYEQELLRRYHFAVDPAMVDPVLFAVASESSDSILASLGPDGTRARHGARPGLGVIARVDGDSLTFPRFLADGHPIRTENGRLRIRDASEVAAVAGHAFFRELVVRDAKDRGLLEDPRVARELRLIREEAATEAMVARALPKEPDAKALRVWFDGHAARYRRPVARRVRAVSFASRDSAAAMLRLWNGVGIPDSATAALGLKEQPRATAVTLFPGHVATLTLYEGDPDALSRSARTLEPGMVSPVVETPQGFVIAQVLGREPARPSSMDEVIDRVRRDWREEKENEWVQSQLERIRAVTPVQIVPARLEAVNLGPARGTGGGGSAKP
ncbi:MAG: peptidyl-prolyl cis-trans isomerase [Hyphomicrobiales bacterium]